MFLAREWNNFATCLLKLSLMSLCFSEYQIEDDKKNSKINSVKMIRHRKKDNIHHNIQVSIDFIERFFESFSNFKYNSSKLSVEEYQRLRKLYG